MATEQSISDIVSSNQAPICLCAPSGCGKTFALLQMLPIVMCEDTELYMFTDQTAAEDGFGGKAIPDRYRRPLTSESLDMVFARVESGVEHIVIIFDKTINNRMAIYEDHEKLQMLLARTRHVGIVFILSHSIPDIYRDYRRCIDKWFLLTSTALRQYQRCSMFPRLDGEIGEEMDERGVALCVSGTEVSKIRYSGMLFPLRVPSFGDL